MKKRIFSALLSAVIGFTLTAPSAVSASADNMLIYGDVNYDGNADAIDASCVLREYACIATSQPGYFMDDQPERADVDANGAIDAVDASYILGFYAYRATGGLIREIRAYIDNLPTASNTSDLTQHRQILVDENKLCGLLYLGYVSPYQNMEQFVQTHEIAEEYKFLKEIPFSNYVYTPNGTEVYCIFPKSDDAGVIVDERIPDENYTFKLKNIYRSLAGKPIILICNPNEIYSDTLVTIEYDKMGFSWSPCISGKDGMAVVPKEVLDVTKY